MKANNNGVMISKVVDASSGGALPIDGSIASALAPQTVESAKLVGMIGEPSSDRIEDKAEGGEAKDTM